MECRTGEDNEEVEEVGFEEVWRTRREGWVELNGLVVARPDAFAGCGRWLRCVPIPIMTGLGVVLVA